METPLSFLALVELLTRRSPAPRAHPTELRRLLRPEDVAGHRALYCSSYDECLEVALSRRWRSWSCQACAMARGAPRQPGPPQERLRRHRIRNGPWPFLRPPWRLAGYARGLHPSP